MNIETVEKADHLKLIEVLEASVRATHDFLAEVDQQELRPLILEQYFDAVDLRCAKNAHGEIQGFCGVHDGNIEMLFISYDARGKGIGAWLSPFLGEFEIKYVFQSVSGWFCLLSFIGSQVLYIKASRIIKTWWWF